MPVALFLGTARWVYNRAQTPMSQIARPTQVEMSPPSDIEEEASPQPSEHGGPEDGVDDLVGVCHAPPLRDVTDSSARQPPATHAGDSACPSCGMVTRWHPTAPWNDPGQNVSVQPDSPGQRMAKSSPYPSSLNSVGARARDSSGPNVTVGMMLTGSNTMAHPSSGGR